MEEELTQVAVDVGIAWIVVRTGTFGLVTDDGAKGVVGARIGDGAGADALAIAAALSVWTIVVRTASRIFDRNCSTERNKDKILEFAIPP